MSSNSPVVTVIDASSGLRPVANALGAASSTTYSFGIGVPVAMQRFSTSRWKRGASAAVTATAPDIAIASRSAKKYWKVAYPAAKIRMNAVIHQLLPASHPASRPIAPSSRMNAPRMNHVLRLLRAMALYIR